MQSQSLQLDQLQTQQPDEFQDPNFDPIAYLNKRFPNEQSLSGLDDEISKLNSQLGEVNTELIEEIHQHAMMNIEISEEIQKAKSLSKEIIKEIGIIKDKATKSEEIVYDMCKDLKSLDIAKKNLTFSIDALKKFIMMVDALEKLRDACENKVYTEVANLLSAFNELSNHFKKYEQISQIQDLYKEKNAIVEELHSQITEDFEAYQSGNSALSVENMAAACNIIEILGDKYHRKFVQAMNQILLKGYQQQYGNSENGVLQNTDRRYGLIKRKMQDFNVKFERIIPKSWGIDCLILYEFCSITRIHLTTVLHNTSHTVAVSVMMKALELSLKFENKITEEMRKKYEVSVKEGSKKKIQLQALPKFTGSISNSFEPYLMPYIKSQEDALMQGLYRSLQDDKLTEIKVYNSSIVLFHGIKNAVKRASTYSKGTLLLDILKVIKKLFRVYSQKCFQKARNKENFYQNVCWIINTGEYCKNIIDGVREVLDNTIDPAYKENINFSDEEDIFSNLISKSIQLFISSLESTVDSLFNAIWRTNWDKFVQLVDISEYVQETKILLNASFVKIKDQLDTLYLTLYMDKVVVLIANKFIHNLYRCKKLPTIAFQQLHMDIIELKVTLQSIVKSDQRTYSNPRVMKKYVDLVNKTFMKGENLIKLMGLNNQQFAERFEMFMEGAGLQELDKILHVRGSKRSDFPGLVKSIENKVM